MKIRTFFICMALIFAAEIAVIVVFAVRTPDIDQDAVEVNEVVQSVTADFNSMHTHKNTTALDYVVLDLDDSVLYKTGSGLSESINSAITHRDTVLDIEKDGLTVGKVIIYNDAAAEFGSQKNSVIIVISIAMGVQCVVCAVYAVFMYFSVIKPFRKLKGFAERVADGNLDIPLEMDRQNLFGAFTESFDIMRSELKKSRLAEANANRSKKELVAKLSHDIKTPVASIKAVSEVAVAVAQSEKDRDNYRRIIDKADQINTLVTDLFTATLEELCRLSVTPVSVESGKVKTMLEKADYMHRASIPDLPECLVYADPLRLQQVFDNIIVNSYKYANTEISVSARVNEKFVTVEIEDKGGGVRDGELPVVKEKYRRGDNAKNIEGAGLGLYISDYLMNEMGGELTVENGEYGLKVIVSLLLSGAN